MGTDDSRNWIRRALRDFRAEPPLTQAKTVVETIVFVLAIVGAVMVYLQLGQTSESNALTRRSVDAMLALERPRVVVESITQPSLSSRSDPVIATIRNVGRSVAQSIEIETHVRGLDQTTELPCTWSAKRVAAIGLGPGQETTYTTPGIDIDVQMANRIVNKDAKMFLWFSVSYTDALRAEQREVFCFVVTGAGLTNERHPPTHPWRLCESADYKPNARSRCE